MTHLCPCGVSITASDADTLRWGVETHRCRQDGSEAAALDWLAAFYGRPFWLCRRGVELLVVGGG